jgi:transposase
MLDRAFGMDVHQETMVIGKLLPDGKETKRFSLLRREDIEEAKEWLRKDDCTNGVMESTGIYWVPIYADLKEAGFNLCVANAQQVKAVPGRKSDHNDAEWLAYLLRAELIKPSYIPDEKHQELRTLTRLRTKLVETQTSFKNRAHKILQLCNIRIASKVSKLFGPSGMTILKALTDGSDIDKAIDSCHKKIRAKREEIKESIMGTLGQTDVFELKICLENIKTLEEQVKQVDERIEARVDHVLVEKLVKLPGVAPTTAAVAIAEIGEATRFEDDKHVAGWVGLAPSRYQSAGKDRRGHITKRGDAWLRKAMVQAAKAASKSKTEFGQFYSRIAGRRGKGIATVALARELLGEVWKTILTGKEYVEGQSSLKKVRYKLRKATVEKYDTDEVAAILADVSGVTASPG